MEISILLYSVIEIYVAFAFLLRASYVSLFLITNIFGAALTVNMCHSE